MKVDTAFLNAPLDEDIYMLPRNGYVIEPNKVLKLKKRLHSLKHSPRNFNLFDIKQHTIFNNAFLTRVSTTRRSNGHDI